MWTVGSAVLFGCVIRRVEELVVSLMCISFLGIEQIEQVPWCSDME